MSVRKRIAHGVVWVLLEKVGQQALTFVVFLVVARLVGPEEFGLAGLCMVFSALASFVIFGSVDGVVSLRLNDDRRLSTLFWTVVFIGALLSLLTYLAAVPFSVLMKDARLIGLLRWFGTIPFLIAITAIPTVLVQARMDFRIFTIRSLVSTILSGILGIYLALKGYGAYALIHQQIARQIIIILIIWPSARWAPKLTFERAVLREVLAPGVKMTGSTLLTFIEQQVPRLIIGAILGPVQVGFYAFVTRIFATMREVLVLPLTTVLFPALAQIRDDKKEARKIVSEIIFLTGVLIFPALAGAAATAPQFVPLFFGESWGPAASVLQIFLAAMTPAPFLLIIREIFRAHQETGAFVRFQLVVVICGLLVTAILTPYGLIAVAIGIAGVAFGSFPFLIRSLGRVSHFRLGSHFFQLWPPLAGCLAMIAAIEAAQRSTLHPSNDWGNLIFSVFLGAFIYALVCVILRYQKIRMLAVQFRGLIAGRKKGESPELRP